MNGQISENPVDKEMMKAGDVIEWRYAEETDGSCGGVPDYHKVKNLLQQYKGMQNTYLGPLEREMTSPFSPSALYGPYARPA
jgi:hypothetical protein